MQPSQNAAHGPVETRIRRILRITTNSLTALSLLICMATVALWLRSYWVRDLVITTSHRLIIVPYWFPAGLFALAPLARLIGTRGRLGLLGVMIAVAAIAVVLACLRPPPGS